MTDTEAIAWPGRHFFKNYFEWLLYYKSYFKAIFCFIGSDKKIKCFFRLCLFISPSFPPAYFLFFLFLQCQKETKVDLWRRKTGKEKITLSRKNRQEKENRTWEFFLREITWDWNNWSFCLLLTHTPSPLFLPGPGWLAPPGRHVGACFAVAPQDGGFIKGRTSKDGPRRCFAWG